LLVAFLSIAAALAGLWAFELYSRNFLAQPGDEVRYSRAETFSTQYLDLISGTNHNLPNQTHRGPAPWEYFQYPNGYDIHSGKFGFFTDEPVDDFPAKDAKEYRIVLIGGSGAQGNGGRTNDDMFYRLLEKALQSRFDADGIRIRIINLAMAGGLARTNLQDLRAYGHPLMPDMILAYNGVNDVSQAFLVGHFLPAERPYGLAGMNSYYPWYLEWLVELFPRTMLVHGVGPKLRTMLDGDRFPILGWQKIPQPEVSPKSDSLVFYQREILPNIIDSFKAMKREFCGLPIVLVRQVWGEPVAQSKWLEERYGMQGKLTRPLYDDWWIESEAALHTYFNDKWYFLDAERDIWGHVEGTKIHWIDGKTYDLEPSALGVHLNNQGQRLLSEWLAPQIEPIVRADFRNSRENRCDAAFARH
jgi:lysophospholipase L1-like esterase